MKLAINETKSVSFNNLPFVFFRKTKWTYQCLNTAGDLICSEKSIPKLMVKSGAVISEMYKKTIVKKPEADESKKAKPKKAQASGDSKEVTEKRKSIKTLTFEMIVSSKDDQEIIDTVKMWHPVSKFNQSHVSWYRSTLFRDGIIGPEHAPRRSTAYKTWKKEQSKD